MPGPDCVAVLVANLLPVAEMRAVTACAAERSGRGEVRHTGLCLCNLRCEYGCVAGSKVRGVFHDALSHEILLMMVAPVWLRFQTNHAKAMPLLALRPCHPARCIIGRRLRKQ
jgi:hypothetical protein